MKILVIDRNNNLSWVDVTYKDRYFRSLDEETTYYLNQIYAVKDDNRSKTVICSYCGKEVSNSPSAIKSHRNMVHKSNKCFDCYYLKHINEKVLSQKYVLNEDGTYFESTKRNVKLVCNHEYRKYDINTEDAKRVCKYRGCENAEFYRIKDFLTEYPDAFDEFITIDRIIDSGYKEMYKYNDHITFHLKGKTRIAASVNNQGICFSFRLDYQRNSYVLRYSKKYDRVWVFDGTVRELEHYGISNGTKEAILKTLRKLYA